MTRLIRPSVVACLVLALTACSDGTPGNGSGGDVSADATGDLSGDIPTTGSLERVETSVSPAIVRAGETATITCSALTSDGTELGGQTFEISVSPEAGATLTGVELVPTVTGTYMISCAAAGKVDGTPFELRVDPGVPFSTVASVVPPSVEAGGSAEVTCAVADAFGNVIDPSSATVVVSAAAAVDVAVSDRTISTDVAGLYDVSCDVAGAEDVTSASWTVLPGAPVSFELVLSPEPLAYALGQGVKVSGLGLDSLGNSIADMPIADLDAAPAGSHTVFGSTSSSIRFDLEGFYTISAASADDATLTATRDIVVDQTAPLIEILSPARGMIADGISTVTFSGNVSDNLGEVSLLEINGEAYELPAEGGPFSLEVDLAYGINVLSARAVDPYGNERTVAQSVLSSEGWYTLDPAAFETDAVSDGIVAALSQEALDDGDHSPDDADDLATILGGVLAGGDLAGLLGGQAFQTPCIGGQCDLTIKTLTIEEADITLEIIEGGLHVELDFTELEIIFELDAPGLPAFDLRVATDALKLEVDLFLTVTGGVISATADKPKLVVEDVFVGLFGELGIPGIDGAVNALIDFIEPAIVGILETVFGFLAEGLIEDVINGLADSIAIDTELELPALAEGLTPNTIQLVSKPSQLQFTPGYMKIDLDAVAHAKVPVPPRENLGSVRYTSCAPNGSIAVPPSAPIGAGIHEDFINQLLFAIWQGGTLSLDLGPEEAAGLDLSQFGADLQGVKVDPMLPLIFNSCSGEKQVQVGDLFLDVELTLFGTPSHFVLWLQAGAAVDVVPSTTPEGGTLLTFAIGEFDPLLLEIITNEGLFENDDKGLVELIAGLVPLLLEQVAGDSLSFEVPSFDLGELIGGTASGAVINLDLQSIGKSGAFVTLDAALK